MKKVSILAFGLPFIFFLQSCSDSIDEGSSLNLESEVEASAQSGGSSGPSDPSNSELFYFVMENGECQNESGEKGYNDGILECGDMSAQNLSEIDLKNKTLYGLSLKGSTIVDSKLNFKNIADREMRVDEQTFFEKVRNPFTRLFDQHLSLMNRENKKAVRFERRSQKLLSRIDLFKEKILATDNEVRKKKLAEKILLLRQKVDGSNQQAIIAVNKKGRHRGFATKLYDLVLQEPAYLNPKIRNKLSLELVGNSYLIGKPSSNYFSAGDSFSLSVWIRTDTSQNDKRILNFHHKESPGSSVNLMLKSKTIVFGYRNESTQYFELNHAVDYADSNLHHVVGSYDGQTFRLFVDGQLVDEKVDSHVGFGEYPFIVGSYDGKSRFFNGSIDEVSLWQEALSEEAVAALYYGGIPTNLKRHLDVESLRYWWRMGDAQKKNQDPQIFRDLVKKEDLNLKN